MGHAHTTPRTYHLCLIALFVLSTLSTNFTWAQEESSSPAHASSGSSSGAPMKAQGIMRNLLIGPSVGLSVPLPLTAGLEMRWGHLIGLAVEGSMFPERRFEDALVSAQSYRGIVKLFPWQRAFYLGVGYGRQTIKSSLSATNSGVTATVSMDIEGNFLTPLMGWQWLWASGFFIGTEIGVQLPRDTTINIRDDASTTFRNTKEYKNAMSTGRSAAEKLADTPLPHLAFKLGFFF